MIAGAKGVEGSEWTVIHSGGPMKSDPLFHPLLHEIGDLESAEEALGIQEGTPIFVSPDGEIDARLTAFTNSWEFSSLKRSSRDRYENAYRAFFRHQSAAGRDIFAVTKTSVGKYKIIRSDPRVNPDGFIAGSSWNTECYALDLLFTWAVEAGHMPRNPLDGMTDRGQDKSARDKRKATKEEQERDGVLFKAKNARQYRDKWLDGPTYQGWRDIGMLGKVMLPGSKPGKFRVGGTDPAVRVRNKQRNRAYADLMFTTGMRRQENAALLTCELPPQLTGTAVEFPLSRATTKYSTKRMVMEPATAAMKVHQYLTQERVEAVRRAQKQGRYDSPRWIRVVDVGRDRTGVKVTYASGAVKHVKDLSPEARRLLLSVEDPTAPEPLALWLTESGIPMSAETWEGIFREASRRFASECARVGVPTMTVSPHTLRFSFALMYLLALHQRINEKMGYDPHDEYDPRRYDAAWRRVQVQLGHQSITTTKQHYLDAFVDLRDEDLLSGAEGDVGQTIIALAERDPRVRAYAE